jgi:tRNA uridine 5-carbamoylmethylation protein Kti12
VTTIFKYPLIGQTGMIIMRGLPCSGKSHTTQTIVRYADDRCEVVRVSANDYFDGVDGVYRFDAGKLTVAHGDCFRKAITWAITPVLPGRSRLIVVDNTNISSWEISPYIALAQAYAIPCSILTIDCASEVRLRRNAARTPDRRIPEIIMANMAMRMREEKLPPLWDNVITKSF